MKNLKYNTLILFVLVQLLGCESGTKATPETAPESTRNNLITVSRSQFDQNNMALGTLEEMQFPNIIKATGTIDVPPENRMVVNAMMGGYMKTLPLLIGDVVKKGQVLLTLENPEFVTLQQDYMEIKAQLGYLNSEFDRQKMMFDENISSQKSYLKAESDYKIAMAQYDGLRKQLAMLHISAARVEAGEITSTATIYAPISGSITQVNVTRGSYVAPATPILEIIDNDHIHIELAVFEKDIMDLKIGQSIKFKIPEASSETFEAKVHLVGTAIGEGRTIKVHGHLMDKEKNKFLTGMFVDADIIKDTQAGQAVPSETVVDVADKEYVLVLENENEGNYYFKKVEVQVKNSYQGYTNIGSNDLIQPSDVFLTKGAFNLLSE